MATRIANTSIFFLGVLSTLTACGGGGSGAVEAVASDTAVVVEASAPVADSSDTTASDDPKPNILLIISDDQGLDSSAQYALSQDLPATPTLDTLAANGLVFDNFWATPGCTTTRSALITGKYGTSTGVLAIGDELPASEEVLHRYLASDEQTAQYQSALIGKWHLGGNGAAQSHPNDMGIPYFAGSLGGAIPDYYAWTFSTNGQSEQSTSYNTTQLTDSAIEWIQEQSSSWFLWLAYVAPHLPLHLPPADLSNRYLSGQESDIEDNPRDYYLAAIEAMDTEIGRLLDSMSEEQRSNTIVFFIGDNGTPAQVTDSLVYVNGSKATLAEGGIAVPMIASGMGVGRRNERESALINATDFFATIAQLAGSDVSAIHDSVSFRELLSETDIAPRQYNYVAFESERETGWAIRNQQYKLIEYAEGQQVLYDLINDPLETTELLGSGGDYSSVRSELLAELDAIR
ncbi:sulfatase-like hydrolase/transferase [Congregibacter litoralis]|uniref:sulfatase-like hydrolase/transferase n=1 Tax=Congregibacter litoralis TaxID=393662 RepID=UPI00006B5EB8|nr:sulfatase-like hydrolase/transferase [Congregibacter litoralis]